jgi:hypothetical protein
VETGPAIFSIRSTASKIPILCSIAIAITLTVATAPQSSAQASYTPEFVNDPQFALFGGVGANLSRGHSQGAMQLGAAIGEAPLNACWGFQLEGGYIGPWANPKTGSALFSASYLARWKLASNKKFIPFVNTGYSKLSHAGNAINFGGGLEYRLGVSDAIRIEVRDYYAFSEPSKQNLALRIGWVMYLSD